MKAFGDFTAAALIAVLPGWLVLGAGAVPFALFAGGLVAWDSSRRRQIASGASMK